MGSYYGFFLSTDSMYLFIDTETTGLPDVSDASYKRTSIWPYIVQIGFIVCDKSGAIISENEFILAPDGYAIPRSSSNVHHITNEYALKHGKKRKDVLNYMDVVMAKVDYIIGHNVEFDINALKCEILREKGSEKALSLAKKHIIIDTMKWGTLICKIPALKHDGYKYPTLEELYYTLFKKDFPNQHNALCDIKATFECFHSIISRFPNLLPELKRGKGYLRYVETDELDGLERVSGISVVDRAYQQKDGKMNVLLSMCFDLGDKKRFIPISFDSDLVLGDKVDINTVELITFEQGEKEIYRVDGDIRDEEESGWEVVASKILPGIRSVTNIYIVNKHYSLLSGREISRKSMCFEMDDGNKHYIPLCNDSVLEIADEVDIESVRLYTYEKAGIYRYRVDGDCLRENLGYLERVYTDISDYEDVSNIEYASVDEVEVEFHSVRLSETKRVIRIKKITVRKKNIL